MSALMERKVTATDAGHETFSLILQVLMMQQHYCPHPEVPVKRFKVSLFGIFLNQAGLLIAKGG